MQEMAATLRLMCRAAIVSSTVDMPTASAPNIRNIAIVIGINFLWPFASALVSSIGRGSFTEALAAIQVSWQAHLGGLLTGALIGFIYARTRTAERRTAQIWLLAGVGVGLLALLVIPPLLYT